MWIVPLALRRPSSFVVMALLIATTGVVPLVTMHRGRVPSIETPIFSTSLIKVNFQPGADTGSPVAPATGRAPPIPPAGPLALPKSLEQVGVPQDATRRAIPADGAQPPEIVALGQKLFFDGRLSGDGTVACSTCHNPARGFADGRSVSIGVKGRTGQRNAPTILNALYNKTQFWDGRA